MDAWRKYSSRLPSACVLAKVSLQEMSRKSAQTRPEISLAFSSSLGHRLDRRSRAWSGVATSVYIYIHISICVVTDR